MRPGQPHVAVFENLCESYALGCVELDSLWSAIPHQTVDAATWDTMLAKNRVVGDIRCDGQYTQVYYHSEGPPVGALVFSHRDGRVFRHYVDNPGWPSAIKNAAPTPISPRALEQIAPHRGVDFHKAVGPTPPPPAPQGVSKVHLFNCHSQKHLVTIWLQDLGNQQWRRLGALSPQWDDAVKPQGSCPRPGATPFEIPLENGHSYRLVLVDPAWCHGQDDPSNGGCHKMDSAFRGVTGGPIVPLTAQ
jgi:hypothetical protein